MKKKPKKNENKMIFKRPLTFHFNVGNKLEISTDFNKLDKRKTLNFGSSLKLLV